MDRKQFLSTVKEEADLADLRQADQAVRVVVGVLKALLPPDVAETVTGFLPEDLRLGWEAVEAYPADILEREDIFFEGASGPGGETVPTVTQG